MCKSFLLAISLVLLSGVMAPSVARAQAASKETQLTAKKLYQTGLLHYNLGNFDAAIDDFKKAYELTQSPALLFNLGQAYRLKKDYERALYLYRTYLRLTPKAPNRAYVENHIADLEAQGIKAKTLSLPDLAAEEEPAPPPAPVVEPEAAPMPVAIPEPVPQVTVTKTRPSMRALGISGIVVGVAGLAVLAGGIAVGIQSKQISDRLSALSQNGGTWSQEYANQYSDGQSKAQLATVLDVVGGVVTAAGVVMTAVGFSKAKSKAPASAMIPTGFGLSKSGGQVAWTF